MHADSELHGAAMFTCCRTESGGAGIAPSGSVRGGIQQYRHQLAETRSLLFQQEALRMVASGPPKDAQARREFVLKRVTREFWTNFCVRGQDTAMLRHLQTALREEFGEDLQFFYPPGGIHMSILHDGPCGPEPVSPETQAAIVNRAWKLARDLVAEHMAE